MTAAEGTTGPQLDAATPDRSGAASSGPWEARAACAGLPTDWWFPENKQTARATRVCATCPVVVECLVAAMAHDSEAQVQADTGVWGGCGPRARRFGTAAHLEGGEAWEAALTAHLSWLAVVASGVSLRLPKHPWNATGKEQITHGTVGGYNHCTEGTDGGACDLCKFEKGRDADRRRLRGRMAAAALSGPPLPVAPTTETSPSTPEEHAA